MALSRARTSASSCLACIRISVSALTPNAFSNRTAIFRRQARPAAQQVAHRLPQHARIGGGGGDAQAVRLDHLAAQSLAG